jgi:hypothetical protein
MIAKQSNLALKAVFTVCDADALALEVVAFWEGVPKYDVAMLTTIVSQPILYYGN